MIKFEFNKEKSISALLYVTKLIKKADLHKISKILYFADQKHLTKYGTVITGDFYIAMEFGPVPSRIYDIFKAVRGDGLVETDEFNEYFNVSQSYLIKPLKEPDMDEFSESDIECINESIVENKELEFEELVSKSHGKAYKSAKSNCKISLEEIAKEGGANSEMLKYIGSVAENYNIFC